MLYNSARILIVDDDQQICELIKTYLVKYNFKVSIANDSIGMKKELSKHTFDLVILDIMLPGQNGIALCQEIRKKSNVAIIMLSAIGEEADRIMSLEIGADDYLTKPFSLRELLARINSLLRRTTGELAQNSSISGGIKLKFSGWTLDTAKHMLIAPDCVTVPISRGEYDILLAFIEHPQQVLTRDQLLDLTQGREATSYDRSIDVLIGRLRKKIENDPKNPQIIATVRSVGYQFIPEITRD